MRKKEVEEWQQPTENTHFKAFKHGHKGYQAMESQVPPPKFPSTLASFVLVFEIDPEWDPDEDDIPDGQEPPQSFAKLNMQPLLDKLRSADMIVREEKFGTYSKGTRECFALVSISEKRQKQVAEIMGMKLRMKALDDEDNEIKQGGAWHPFKQHLAEFYEKSSEGTLFSSCQQCQIMEFMLNERDERAMGPQLIQKEACEPGNTPLQQLVKDQRIKGYFYLHHMHKQDWLEENWVNTWANKQPIEDIREYFGEEIGLYFVWLGYILTSLWVPAIVGVMVFIVSMVAAGQSGSTDNPFNPLYAIFIALWSIMVRAGWERLETTYQYQWGTVDYEEPEQDRTEFVQNVKTYKRLNYISQKEEFYPDPLWRYIFVFAGFLAVCALIAVNILLVLLIEAGKSQIQEFLGLEHAAGMVPKVLGASVQATVILLMRKAADIAFGYLTDFENWKSQEQYDNATIAKRFCFGFINSYFCIYFVAFMANHISVFGVDVSCPEHKCIDYVEWMIGVIFLSNILVRYFTTKFYPPRRAPEPKKPGQKEEPPEPADDDDDVDKPPLQEAIETQHGLPDWESTMDDFTDKLIEIGYVMLFGAAFPLLALIALIFNIIDLRAHAKTVLSNYRRPEYSSAADIGTWKTIMDIFSIMSIMSQCAYLGFTTRALYYYFPGMNTMENVFYVVAAEHLLLMLKVYMDGHTQEPDDSVKMAHERREYEKNELLSEKDLFNSQTDVLFYTSDDGNVHVVGPDKGKDGKDGKDKKK